MEALRQGVWTLHLHRQVTTPYDDKKLSVLAISSHHSIYWLLQVFFRVLKLLCAHMTLISLAHSSSQGDDKIRLISHMWKKIFFGTRSDKAIFLTLYRESLSKLRSALLTNQMALTRTWKTLKIRSHNRHVEPCKNMLLWAHKSLQGYF